MFGYIRPVQGELLVKEAEFYRAVYCGLCRYGGKQISCLTRFLLNYDFVFLALLRLKLTNEACTLEKKRCPYKCTKKQMLAAPETYAFVCSAFGLLTYYKALDDLRDSGPVKRFFKRLALPVFRHLRARSGGYPGLEEAIRVPFEELYALEQERTVSLDRTADCFGRLMQGVASYGLEGVNARVASECGYHIGRFIYIIDALDDFRDDARAGNYNPLLCRYGSAEDVLPHVPEIVRTLADSMNAFSRTYALAAETPPGHIDRMIFNICELGGTAAAERVAASVKPDS